MNTKVLYCLNDDSFAVLRLQILGIYDVERLLSWSEPTWWTRAL